MHKLYEEFLKHIEAEDREGALDFTVSKLRKNEIDILSLYTEILSPSLNSMTQSEKDIAFIWREHVRSSIIRTIIENCYPYVVKERDEKYGFKINKKVSVVCPTEEYHEIGARMITDFFMLLGYNAIFVGSNTPKEEFIAALEVIDLDYIAISISNPYSLVAARETIEKIKQVNSRVKIIVGGHAFKNNEAAFKNIEAHMYLETFQDIVKLAEGDRL
jgi:MerR family transcriptional regulator, light-induced transcriptional regulator